jgi:hypothetical protein
MNRINYWQSAIAVPAGSFLDRGPNIFSERTRQKKARPVLPEPGIPVVASFELFSFLANFLLAL